MSDSTDTANILLLGQYTAGQFTSVSDGHSGTLIGDPPAVATDDPNPATLVAPHHA